MTKQCDVLIIGSGLAGLYAGLLLDTSFNVIILTKDRIKEANTYLAQGGIAAAIADEDSPEAHFLDTLRVGTDLTNLEALNILVNEAEENIGILDEMGVVFDREEGRVCLTKEGGHSRSRILHIDGDATGRGMMEALVRNAKKRSNIIIKENSFCMDLLLENNRCIGVTALEEEGVKKYQAKAVILAAGGIGMVYGVTTNTFTATGDAIAMSYRAKAEIKDMEFIQFHPTVFYSEEKQRFLISEAVRGEGAVLRNKSGERFMNRYDDNMELAPRDVVARAIFTEMKRTQTEFVYLDLTHLDGTYIKRRFPTITARCREYGIDIAQQLIPVSPAQHYCMGGVAADLDARTSIEGLYACGEAACTGVHGANRLASNSLLETVVFAKRAAYGINKNMKYAQVKMLKFKEGQQAVIPLSCDVREEKDRIQAAMSKYAGIVRTEEGLAKCLAILDETKRSLDEKRCVSKDYLECVNMLTTAKIIAHSALQRKESVGAHYLVRCREDKLK